MEEASVNVVIEGFFEAMDRQDMEQTEQLIAHDPEMVYFGTDAAERWVGWEDLKTSTEEMFETLESCTISTRCICSKRAILGAKQHFRKDREGRQSVLWADFRLISKRCRP